MFPTDVPIGPGSRVYFYCCTILALGALASGVRMVSDGCRLSLEEPRVREVREIFQDLLPYRSKRFEPLTDDAVESFLLYLSEVGQTIDRQIPNDPLYLATWYDMTGDYLQGYLLPVAKYCFYSGNVTYRSVRSVIEFYRKVKLHLDTDGSGWSRPVDLDSSDADNKIPPLHTSKTPANCSDLDLGISSEIPLPKTQLDDDSRVIISLWIPFRNRQVYDPRSNASLSVLRTFFEGVISCVPKSTRRRFPSRFARWIDESLSSHTLDQEFYPGLEGILQIKKALKNARALEKKSTEQYAGLFENWFAADNSSDVREDYGDYEDDSSLDYVKITIVAIGLGVLLLVIILIMAKMLKNRKIMKRKEKLEQQKPSNQKRFFQRRNTQSDEEVLLALKKNVKKHPAEKRHSWSYIRQPKVLQKLRPGKQLPPFTDTDEDDDDNFEPFLSQSKTPIERLPLLPKPQTSASSSSKKKTRCGPGCVCVTCRAKATPDSSPGYQLSNETAKGGHQQDPGPRTARGGKHNPELQWDEV
uniref:Putative conserved plasma membrane protein n=1 Tax=Culex tarsalis TaxID=7177 RepID=A0A1Q3FTE1_CULTA